MERAAGSGGKIIDSAKDPLFSKSLAVIRAKKQDLQDIRERHACSAKFCNPQSELAFGNNHQCFATNVFLCNFGSVHICSENACEYYPHSSTHTCHVSGFQFGTTVSNYDKNNSRSWFSKPEHVTTLGPTVTAPQEPLVKKRKHVYQTISTEDAESRSGAMLKLLLFSNYRHACNKSAIERFKEEAREARITYLKQQESNGQLPYWSDIYRISSHHMSQPLPLREFEFSTALHDYYVSIMCQVWLMVIKYYLTACNDQIPPRLNFENVCLGTLYSMRQGIRTADNVMLLPKDDFLLINLPIGNQLLFFNIKKNRIGKGETILKITYEHAFTLNAPLPEITINVNLLPQKNGTKLENNGQKLFMPTSRIKKK
jgi:hypothetical protein